MSLIARHLEANGIATVILGSALDVVEHCGIPRFAFVDFPLGNPCGEPWQRAMQTEIVTKAVGLFEQASAPRTTLRLAARWGGDECWRDDYLAVREEDLARLRRQGDERRGSRARLRADGRVRSG